LKKLTAILFLTVYLLSATEAHQLLKLPVVFEHFAEHKKTNKSITFLQFLDMHYMHGCPKDRDYERDMQLPFKTADDCIAAISPAFIPAAIQPVTVPSIEIPGRNLYIPRDQFIPSSYLSRIWQPPKSC